MGMGGRVGIFGVQCLANECEFTGWLEPPGFNRRRRDLRCDTYRSAERESLASADGTNSKLVLLDLCHVEAYRDSNSVSFAMWVIERAT